MHRPILPAAIVLVTLSRRIQWNTPASLASTLIVALVVAGCGGAGDGGSAGGTTTTEPDPVPTAGALAITTVTSGVELDTDGYTVAVDGGTVQGVAPTDTLVVAALEAGTHAVELGGVADNCTTDGGDTHSATTTAGDTTAVAFAVSCGATTGALVVTTSTSGVELDADGYTIALDGGAAQTVTAADSLLFPGLAPGSHSISLDGLTANCTVAGGARQDATVITGDTVAVALAVTCQATTGALAITVATTGDDLDADGYTVILADTVRSLGTSTTTIAVPFGDDVVVPTSMFDVVGDSTLTTIATSGTITASTLPPGTYAILLDGLAAGCATSNDFWVGAPVAAGDTTAVAVTVDCRAPTDDVQLLLATSTTLADGAPVPDGYAVAVNFGDEETIGANEHGFDTRQVGPGPVVVWLRGVPANCTLSGNVQETEIVTTALGGVTGAAFDVTCTGGP